MSAISRSADDFETKSTPHKKTSKGRKDPPLTSVKAGKQDSVSPLDSQRLSLACKLKAAKKRGTINDWVSRRAPMKKELAEDDDVEDVWLDEPERGKKISSLWIKITRFLERRHILPVVMKPRDRRSVEIPLPAEQARKKKHSVNVAEEGGRDQRDEFPRDPDLPPVGTCFNCGKHGHDVKGCPDPYNHTRVTKAF